MSSKIAIIGTVLIVLISTFMLIMFGSSFYKNQTIVTTMQNSIKTSAYANIDYSARVERKLFKLDKIQFEKDLKSSFIKNSGLKKVNGNFSVDYKDENINGFTGTKEITVNFKENKQNYVATIVIDKSED